MKPVFGAEYFPRSADYAPQRQPIPHLIKEPSMKGRAFAYSERHLQAVWYDPRWRPVNLKTHRGEEISVEFAGVWNLEAGPDFLGATLVVGPERRRITGDVELHIFPADWKRHGHAADPRYRNVCLHLTYFEGQLPDAELPPGALQAALRPSLKADPFFAFEHVDLTAYPYAGRADVPPCRSVLSTWPVDDRSDFLDAAGHERMRRKTERYAAMISERGIDQVLYEAFMIALGYQHNKQAFHDLSFRLPVESMRVLAGGDSDRAYALLAGMSGLLPDDMKDEWDEETRTQVRRWWDVWWRNREHLPAPMTRAQWRLNGIRPLNHPLRRMMAAAGLFASGLEGIKLLERWVAGPSDELTKRLMESMAPVKSAYWSSRISLGGNAQATPIALLGRDRLDSMALNIVIPMAAACGFDPGQVRALMSAVKPEATNQVMKQTAYYLFGPDHPSCLCRTANQRQGLLQVFHDYCLNDRSRCRQCELPQRLAAVPTI